MNWTVFAIDIYTRIEEAFTNLGKVVEVLVGTEGKEGPLVKLINVLAEVGAFFIEMILPVMRA